MKKVLKGFVAVLIAAVVIGSGWLGYTLSKEEIKYELKEQARLKELQYQAYEAGWHDAFDYYEGGGYEDENPEREYVDAEYLKELKDNSES